MTQTPETRLLMKRLVWGGATLVALLVGLFVGINVGYERSPLRGPLDLRRLRGVKDGLREEGRITDPTGRLDAVVLTETYGGGAGGGVNLFVSIVQKSQPAVSAPEAVFLARSTHGARLFWRLPHLLEIQYQKAEILDFSNLWSSSLVEPKWFATKEPYWIEIRLAPTSPDFSILSPEGNFQ